MILQHGVVYAIVAFTIWGFFPIYWKQLSTVPDIQVAVHRVVWCGVALLLLVILTCQLKTFLSTAFTKKNFLIYGIAIVLLTAGVFIFVYATNTNRIIEVSLAYFINPMVNAVIGRVILKETLTLWQYIALAIALVGVLIPTIAYGRFPYLAISLAVTTGFYNLAKKIAPLPSFLGLTLEAGIMLLPGTTYLVIIEAQGSGAFGHSDVKTDLFLVGTGIITIFPLFLFAKAAPTISMTLMGILQYICPTIQFLIGVFMYNEPFSTTTLIGFIVTWIALIIFTTDSILQHRRQQANLDHDPTPSPKSDYKASDDSHV